MIYFMPVDTNLVTLIIRMYKSKLKYRYVKLFILLYFIIFEVVIWFLRYTPSCSYIPCGRYSTQSNFDVTSYKKNVAFWNHNNLRRPAWIVHVRNNTLIAFKEIGNNTTYTYKIIP